MNRHAARALCLTAAAAAVVASACRRVQAPVPPPTSVFASADASSGPSWSIVPSPNRGTGESQLGSVACSSARSCVAVGDSESGATEQTLVESWDGTSWSIVPSPNQGPSSELNSVACTSAGSCTAVGSFRGASASQTLVESWDGTAWSIVPSPSQGNAYSDNGLESVACSSPGSCVAVGSYGHTSGNGFGTLTESWNGAAWSIVPSPDPGTVGALLGSVACPSADWCVAVGSEGVHTTLVESWDGRAWSVVPSPNQGTLDNLLFSVARTSASSCVAVGEYDLPGVRPQTLVESWNGTAWSIVPSPNQGTKQNQLSTVACATPSSCVALGAYRGDAAIPHMLIESGNRTSWSIVPNQTVGTIVSVACPSPSECVAVGSSHGASGIQTLVESYR